MVLVADALSQLKLPHSRPPHHHDPTLTAEMLRLARAHQGDAELSLEILVDQANIALLDTVSGMMASTYK